jgi:uncharacterized protein
MSVIGITGGTGFVGRRLTNLLVAKGYEVIIFSRNAHAPTPGCTYAHWTPGKKECDTGMLARTDAIINLAGAGIADKRWTAARKKEIVDSRVTGTRFLTEQIRRYAPRCQTMISASAIGYYGADRTDDQPFTETDQHSADFLGETCYHWEQASIGGGSNYRTVILRFGIVLGQESGAFPKFAMPLSFGVRPILGSGKQMISWIAADDLTAMILYCLEQPTLSGTFNAVAPHPVSYRQLMDTIAQVKGCFSIPLPVPALALRMTLGELGTELLKSCTASAQKMADAGFNFRYPYLTETVKAILSRE